MLYSSVFYLIFLLHEIIGVFELDMEDRNECYVNLETDTGVEACVNSKCSDIKDPWRVIGAYKEGEPCYVNYIKLGFSNYDQLLVFTELQTSSNKALENIFADNGSQNSLIEIEIDHIYPFNRHYFLHEDMLNKLGGTKHRIHSLQLEIDNWYKSPRSAVQVIPNDLIDKQPFEQIVVLYYCNIRQTVERLLLAKYLKYQEQSKCPTQIKIARYDETFFSDDESDDSDDESSVPDTPEKIETIQKNITLFNSPNLTYSSFNKSYSDPKKHPLQWSLMGKIAVVFAFFALVIGIVVYHYFFTSSQSTNTGQ